MIREDIIFDGCLISDNKNIPVKVAYASRCSLYVAFQNGYEVKHLSKFDKLILDIMGKESTLNSCHLQTVPYNLNGHDGRLFFLDDLYDFDRLFSKRTEIINLDKLADNLSLILEQKENIKREFKDYLINFIFDMKVYKNFFDQLDEILINEPKIIKNNVRKVIINGLGKQFISFFNDKSKEMEKIIANFSKQEHEQHGFYLRKEVWDIINCSEFMTRCNIKPRGYAGDAEIMKMIYENSYRGDSTFSQILYRISLERSAAQAVRNRRELIPKFLRETQKEFHTLNNNDFKFFSIACGPASELSQIFISDDDFDKIHCTLLDQDSEALSAAVETISQIEKKKNSIIKVKYIQESVRMMFTIQDLDKEWGKFHFIYSMGLFDYLTPPVAKVILEKIYSLLEPDGKLLIGNFHVSNPDRWFMSYWHDWNLYYREEEDMIYLLSDTDAIDISIVYDDSRCQMFLSARKPK